MFAVSKKRGLLYQLVVKKPKHKPSQAMTASPFTRINAVHQLGNFRGGTWFMTSDCNQKVGDHGAFIQMKVNISNGGSGTEMKDPDRRDWRQVTSLQLHKNSDRSSFDVDLALSICFS